MEINNKARTLKNLNIKGATVPKLEIFKSINFLNKKKFGNLLILFKMFLKYALAVQSSFLNLRIAKVLTKY